MTVTDRTPVNFYKGLSPLLPNEGNYVIFEGNKVVVATSTNVTPADVADTSIKTEADTNAVPMTPERVVLVLSVLLAFTSGLFIAFLFKKK